MYLARVPLELVTEDGGSYLRPKLPPAFHSGIEPQLWGQASSRYAQERTADAPLGSVAVWLRPLARSWIDDLQAIPAVQRVVRVADDSETAAMLAGMKLGTDAARKDFVRAYRAVEAGHEKSFARAKAIERARPVVILAVATLGVAAAARLLGIPEGVLLSLTLLHADTFNRSDRDLNGDTMSDTLGAWTRGSSTGTAAWAIVSNQAVYTQVSGDAVWRSLYDSVMPDTATVRVTATSVVNARHGVCARRSDEDNMYVASRGRHTGGAHALGLWKVTAGSVSQIGSDGSTVSDGNTIGIDCDGTSISGYLNGSVDLGPSTDSDHSTGKCGIVGAQGSVAARTLDSWQVEVGDSAVLGWRSPFGRWFGGLAAVPGGGAASTWFYRHFVASRGRS